jgi:5-methyltetrahydrofolate--homocysteine methyltransferase
MTREEFRKYIRENIVILDGATGTNLMAAGMPVGVCPEEWVMEHPQVILDLQKAYVDNGTNIVYAPTFTGNRIKLLEYGLQEKINEINTTLVGLSKQAVGDRALVAADMTMTGRQLFPLGDLMFEELLEVYKEQARILDAAGADVFVVETMMSLQECRAAVLAIKEVSDLPIMVTLTYNEDGRTLFGTPPETAVVVLQSLGVDAIGVNCSTGPAEMIALVEKMAEYSTVPLIAKPNAGLPELEDGKTVYKMTPDMFADAMRGLVKAGASIVGGCCGTTPEHIRALTEAVKSMPVHKPLEHHRRVLASERKNVEIDLDGNFTVVGERINPTGKKKLQAQLREGKLDLVRQMAMEQETNGARILDINMGMNGIDEKEMMKSVIYEVSSTVDCPLCIDSSYVEVIEEALKIYPGRALINSISLETEKMEKLLPLAAKYGAMFILLPLSDAGLPKDVEEKKQIINTIYDKALSLGMAHEDIVVDGLVATIGANPKAAIECYETIAYCKDEKKLPTICGLSNISFGLPERMYVNTAFLTMAICKGLTMAIANPSQELLMNAAFASDMLLDRPDSDIAYIERMSRLAEEKAQYETVVVKKSDNDASASNGTCAAGSKDAVFQAVLKGNKGSIIDEVKKMLSDGAKPDEIINNSLIPAINEVGELFNQKKYFLPQLIGSANTMKLAIEHLEPLLEKKDSGDDMPTLVIATIVDNVQTTYTYDEAKKLVAKALEPMGDEYVSTLKAGMESGWIDVYENENKRSGAYSWGAYGTHPYVLLNYADNLDSVFTLAHEMGHAMHTYYSNEHQSITYAGYLIFVAEVASTCNESLLMHYMLEHCEDENERKYLMTHFLDGFRTTLFRQAQFAEFEHIAHRKMQKGEPVTKDVLNELWHELNVQYYGPDMRVDDEISYEWMRIPHFYTPYYVYQYSTGYSAAVAFSKKILEEGKPAVDKYIGNFLCGGCSKNPIELLKSAGVDMSTPKPVDDALNVFEDYLKQFETATK